MDGIPAHVDVDGDRGPAELWFLHGIFGAGRNWRTVARRTVEARPGWAGVLVDLRLHGGSRDFPPPHSLAACARDLERLAGQRGIGPVGILGHSFGGKVALQFLSARPAGLRQAWIVDSPPGARPPGGSAVRMLETVRRRPGPFRTRWDGVAALEDAGFSTPVPRWMATNLERREDGWRWAFDPDEMEALLEDFFRTDLWDVVEDPPKGVSLHFVKAEGSGALDGEACRRIERAGATGRVHLHRLPGGHWLNVDDPDGLVELLTRRLPRL